MQRRRRTWLAAKSLGEMHPIVDPGVSEWDNLPQSAVAMYTEYIGMHI